METPVMSKQTMEGCGWGVSGHVGRVVVLMIDMAATQRRRFW